MGATLVTKGQTKVYIRVIYVQGVLLFTPSVHQGCRHNHRNFILGGTWSERGAVEGFRGGRMKSLNPKNSRPET